jgi:hypothetical protein
MSDARPGGSDDLIITDLAQLTKGTLIDLEDMAW